MPHTEVGLILADGCRAGFELIPVPGQRISVFQVRAPLDPTRPDRLRPEPFPELRFLVDLNVGRLAGLLRGLGYDVLYDPDMDDQAMALTAQKDKRVVLSRDRGLLKRRLIQYGRLVRADRPADQFKEVASLFGLESSRMFTRCLGCNSRLVRVDKEKILHRLEPGTRRYFDRFTMCLECDQIYWAGTHLEKFQKRLKMAGILRESA